MKDKVKLPEALLAEINKDHWFPDLHTRFLENCHADGDAIKSINRLVERWPYMDLGARESYDEVFIIVCGWAFETLVEQTNKSILENSARDVVEVETEQTPADSRAGIVGEAVKRKQERRRSGPAIFRCENGVGDWEVRSEENGDEVFDTRGQAEARLQELEKKPQFIWVRVSHSEYHEVVAKSPEEALEIIRAQDLSKGAEHGVDHRTEIEKVCTEAQS